MKVKITVSEILFYIALCLTVTGSFFKQTQVITLFPSLTSVFTAMTLVAIVLLMFKALYDARYDVKRLLFSIVIGAGLILVAFVTDNILLPLTLFAFWFTVNNVSFRRIIMVTFTLLVVYMVVIHLFYLVGEFQSAYDYRPDGQVRQAVGYVFVTFASNYLFHVLLMWWYIRQERLSWIEIGIMALVVVYVYRLTDTRSALLFSLFSIAVMAFIKLFKNLKFQKLSCLVLKYGMFLIGMIPIVLTYAYNANNGLFVRLNSILTDRLRLGKIATQLFSIKPFGQSIDWTFYGDLPRTYANGETYSYFYVDSSFVNILLNYGLLLLLFIFIGHYLLAKLPQFNHKYFAAIILIIALHSMFDPQLIELHYNPFILALGYVVSPIIEKRDSLLRIKNNNVS